MKDAIPLQFSWCFEIRKQHPNVIRLLRVYTPNSFDWHCNIWDLTDPLELIQTDRNNKKAEKNSMYSYVFQWSYKRQIRPDTKSHNAS